MSVASLLTEAEKHLYLAIEAVERAQTIPASRDAHIITARQQIDNAKAALLDGWQIRREP